MEEASFQTWMDSVMPQLVQLSVAQTKTFISKFIQHCTWRQRAFLEESMCSMLRKDLMSLPPLIVDRVLGYLDLHSVLSLRVVCQSWRSHITNRSWLWKSLCQRHVIPAVLGDHHSTSFFHLYMALQRLKHKMDTSSAFAVEKIFPEPRIPSNMNGRDREYNQCVYGENVLAFASKDRYLTAVDAKTNQILWTDTVSSSACLYLSNNLIISGSFDGVVRVLPTDGSFDIQLQYGVNCVVDLDVHKTGRFMIIGYRDASIHLVDNNLECHRVSLRLSAQHHQQSSSSYILRKVFFLSNIIHDNDQLAICVCTDVTLTSAVIGTTGEVLHQTQCVFSETVLNCCQSSSEPSVVFALIQGESGVKVAKYTFCWHSSGISTDILVCSAVHKRTPQCNVRWPELSGTMYLLAAGKELAVAANERDIVIFRWSTGTVISVIHEFLEGASMRKMLLDQTWRKLKIVNNSWLDGLSLHTTQPGTPVITCGPVSYPGCEHEHVYIAVLKWASAWNNSMYPVINTDIRDCDTEHLDTDDNVTQNGCGESGKGVKGHDGEISVSKGSDKRGECNADSMEDYPYTDQTCSAGEEQNKNTVGVWRDAALFKVQAASVCDNVIHSRFSHQTE